MSNFQTLRNINVNDKTEKKNGLTYLSWAWAVDQLLLADPAANWEYHEPQMFGDTMMVSCTVTAFGKPVREYLPVLDYKNRAVPQPDAMAVNTAMKRCLTKCIGLHGLGLYIYAGEDLPPSEEQEPIPAPKSAKSVPQDELSKLDTDTYTWLNDIAANVRSLIKREDVSGAYDEIESHNLAIELKTALWALLDSKERSAIKAVSTQRKAA